MEINTVQTPSLRERIASTDPAWNAYFWLRCEDGVFGVETRHESQNAREAREVYGHIQAWRIDNTTDETALTEYFTTGNGAALVARVVAGYSPEWNGNNMVARFTEDSAEAVASIGSYCENAATLEVSYCDAVDWFYEARNEMGITAASTDAEIESLAEKLNREAESSGVIVRGTAEYLESIREAVKNRGED